jgi:hypothetical protein
MTKYLLLLDSYGLACMGSNLHNCLNTSDQDNSAGDNKEVYNKNSDKPRTCLELGRKKRRWIFVLQTSNKTECMCTNAMKCEKEK